jgi:hypothetical protein
MCSDAPTGGCAGKAPVAEAGEVTPHLAAHGRHPLPSERAGVQKPRPLIRPATAGENACRGPPSPLGEGWKYRGASRPLSRERPAPARARAGCPRYNGREAHATSVRATWGESRLPLLIRAPISRRSEGVSTPSACGWAGRAQPLRDVLASARRSSSPLRVDILLAL